MSAVQLRIQSINLKNFRKYVGNQTIELSTDPKKPVTVIHGTSGKGKTTFLNSIHWCIWGKERDNVSVQIGEDEGLIHSGIIDNMKINDTEKIHVEIILEDDEGPLYKIKRGVEILKKSDQVTKTYDSNLYSEVSRGIETKPFLEFSSRNQDTGEHEDEKDLDTIKHKLGNIFPEILSSYILFDAELLNTFQSQDQGVLVREGMEKITGLPVIYEAKKNIDNVKNKIRRDSSGGDEEYQRQITRQTKVKEDIDEFEEDAKILKKRIETDDKIVQKCTDFIQKNGDESIKKDEDLRLQVVDNIILIEKAVRKLKEENLDLIFSNLHKFYIKNEIDSTIEIFDKYAKEGLFPTAFNKEQIQKVLREEKCLCGRDVTDNEKEIKNKLEHMLTKVYDLQEAGELNKIRNSMMENSSSIKNNELKELEKKMKDCDIDLIEYRKQLKKQKEKKKELDEKLESSQSIKKELQEKAQLRSTLESSVTNNKYKLGGIQENMNAAMNAKRQNDKVLKKLEENMNRDEAIQKQIELADYATEIFEQLKNESLDSFREQVQEAAQEYFLNTAPEKETFTGVEIDDGFIIKAKTDKTTRKISAGQIHCLGLSYIAAIRKVTKHNYFMVIDSPFHNISPASKLSLCKEVPLKMGVTQTTFLVTDTEYKAVILEEGKTKRLPSVKEILKETGLLWKQYDINLEEKNGLKCAVINEDEA